MRPPLLALLLVCGCAVRPPPETPAAPRAREATLAPPDDCAGDFSGLWRASEDDGFRYLARDDGGVLVLEATHQPGDGGAETSQVVLVRSPGNFVGAVGVARHALDGGCAVLFPAEVVSCADGGLVVASVDRLRVDAQCRPLVQPTARSLHRLVRVVPPDAGS